MRAVLQKVKQGSVLVDGAVISSIGPGLVALIGVGHGDGQPEVKALASKILSLRLWNEDMKVKDVARQEARALPASSTADPQCEPPPSHTTESASTAQPPEKQIGESVWGDLGRPWRTSVVDLEGEILCVSQFTLLAQTKRGTKPDFHRAMKGPEAKELYDSFLATLSASYQAERIKDGRFGAMMDVSLVNDGPVTILLDTDEGKGTH